MQGMWYKLGREEERPGKGQWIKKKLQVKNANNNNFLKTGVWWCMPVIPAMWEVQTGGFQSRPTQA
jgi:hypothetical protein